MPIVTLPAETAGRLKERINGLGLQLEHRLFKASDVVMGIVFTDSETREFNNEAGDAMILAVTDLAELAAAIPEFEDGRRNYCVIKNDRAIARLDPFTPKP